MSGNSTADAKRSECWNNALRAFGTAYILERRAGRIRTKRRVIAFLGLVVPVLVGIIATKVSKNSPVPEWLITSASAASAAQAVVSIWSLIARWEDTLSDCIRGANKNYDLQVRWEGLPPEGDAKVEAEYPTLLKAASEQRESDIRQLISSREKTIGMRAALHHSQRECARCNKTPSSETIPFFELIARRCKVCGERQ